MSRVKGVYAFYDVSMQMFTDPCTLRNDVEAKKLFKSLLDKDHFNGCPVELYKVGLWHFDSDINNLPMEHITPVRIYTDDTIEDGEDSVEESN